MVLAVWRVTHLVQAEDGPFDLIVRLRSLAGNGLPGKLMDCFCCLSIWVALPAGLYFGQDWCQRPLLWLALSAGAIILEKFSQ
jgi:hypothetical protein